MQHSLYSREERIEDLEEEKIKLLRVIEELEEDKDKLLHEQDELLHEQDEKIKDLKEKKKSLHERDKKIDDLKGKKKSLEKFVEDLTEELETKEASAGSFVLSHLSSCGCLTIVLDKYKEENRKLQATIQELRTKLQDAQTARQNSESERQHVTNQLLAARDSIEQHKNEVNRLTMNKPKNHETDVVSNDGSENWVRL